MTRSLNNITEDDTRFSFSGPSIHKIIHKINKENKHTHIGEIRGKLPNSEIRGAIIDNDGRSWGKAIVIRLSLNF